MKKFLLILTIASTSVLTACGSDASTETPATGAATDSTANAVDASANVTDSTDSAETSTPVVDTKSGK